MEALWEEEDFVLAVSLGGTVNALTVESKNGNEINVQNAKEAENWAVELGYHMKGGVSGVMVHQDIPLMTNP